MRRIQIISFIFPLLLIACSSYSKYPDEIKLAYDYLETPSQETIKNWKNAQVEEIMPTNDLKIFNEEENTYITIKDVPTLVVEFNTKDDAALGPIKVYIDKGSKQVLGIGVRK